MLTNIPENMYIESDDLEKVFNVTEKQHGIVRITVPVNAQSSRDFTVQYLRPLTQEEKEPISPLSLANCFADVKKDEKSLSFNAVLFYRDEQSVILVIPTEDERRNELQQAGFLLPYMYYRCAPDSHAYKNLRTGFGISIISKETLMVTHTYMFGTERFNEYVTRFNLDTESDFAIVEETDSTITVMSSTANGGACIESPLFRF